MLEVTTSWTIPSGISTKSVMYFADGTDIVAARNRVKGALGSITDRLASGVTFTVDHDCRILNSATGALQGIVADATVQEGVGSGAALPIPDASQVLMVWDTGVVIGGRFLKGHTYIPGLDANLLTNGNLGASAAGAFANAANLMTNPSAGFGVWHRPKGGAGGQHVLATGGGVKLELAVLRRRRNR